MALVCSEMDTANFFSLTLEPLSRNIAPLQFKTERVSETILRASWFWPTSPAFPETSGIYSSPKDSKLTLMALVCSEMDTAIFFLRLTFEILGRNIAPIHFKTEIVAETALDASWFWPTSAWFPGSWRIFSIPGEAKLIFDGLSLQLNGHGKTF